MTLLQMLLTFNVRWPEAMACATQDGSDYVRFWSQMNPEFIPEPDAWFCGLGVQLHATLPVLASDYTTAVVTKAQYLEARKERSERVCNALSEICNAVDEDRSDKRPD